MTHVLDPVVSAAYGAQQLSLMTSALALHQTVRFVSRNRIDFEPAPAVELRRRYLELLRRDLHNVREGLYPRALLFQFPYVDYLRVFPALLRELPRVLRRRSAQNFEDLPAAARGERYPRYFRRNFHWQTDGYFSRQSAALYDAGVELLFMGTADVMRRQIIPPITRFVREQRGGELKLLDIACGTGRGLLQLALAHPQLRYYGLDLSPYYVQQARELLADFADVSLVVENAESMPFLSNHFDIVTSIYLFHELPKDVRRRVMHEAFRVLRPGGLLVFEDSGQLSDSEDVAFFFERFAEDFHEPYYKGYLRDPLEDALAEVGFEIEPPQIHLVSKVVIARKPLAPEADSAA
jgi:ubiquinone/menaquinone biosynthesis C-methylase UbiE